jgi:hypothetical protein
VQAIDGREFSVVLVLLEILRQPDNKARLQRNSFPIKLGQAIHAALTARQKTTSINVDKYKMGFTKKSLNFK